MPMTKKQFRDYLALYGPSPEQWPQALSDEARNLMQLPAFAALTEEEERLESLLRQRRLEPPRYGLADRIIASARDVPQLSTPAAWLKELLGDHFSARPAYALAGALVLGVVIGFSLTGTVQNTSSTTEVATLSEGIYDEGDYL